MRLVSHYDPEYKCFPLPINEDLGLAVSYVRVSSTSGIEVGNTITLQLLPLISSNTPFEGQLVVAHDSATVTPSVVFTLLLKQLFIAAERCGWKSDGLKIALDDFDKQLNLCTTMPFQYCDRMKMTAVKSKDQLSKLRWRLDKVYAAFQEARDPSTGDVSVPIFTKVIFEQQNFMNRGDHASEFYEKIRGLDPELLKHHNRPVSLFEVNEKTSKLAAELTASLIMRNLERSQEEEIDEEMHPSEED